MTDTAAVAQQQQQRRRSSSISEYSQIFSQNAPKPSSFIGQKRHPSLSMRGDPAMGKLGLNVSNLAVMPNESAIDDTDMKSPASVGQRMDGSQSIQTGDPVGLARRLSQGARAIMYNGNRLRGDSVASGEQPASSTRTFSQGSMSSASPSSLGTEFASPLPNESSQGRNLADAAKIKRRLSPTGERMLRGELTFH